MSTSISIKSCHLIVKMTLWPLASSHKMAKGGLSWCQTGRKKRCPSRTGALPGISSWASTWPNLTSRVACARPLQNISMWCRGWPGTMLDGGTMTVISASWSLRALRSGDPCTRNFSLKRSWHGPPLPQRVTVLTHASHPARVSHFIVMVDAASGTTACTITHV